jgi:hypothetical protein
MRSNNKSSAARRVLRLSPRNLAPRASVLTLAVLTSLPQRAAAQNGRQITSATTTDKITAENGRQLTTSAKRLRRKLDRNDGAGTRFRRTRQPDCPAGEQTQTPHDYEADSGATRCALPDQHVGHAAHHVRKVTIGLQSFSGATVVDNTPVTFNGQRSVTVPVGAEVFSDPVRLDCGKPNNGNGNGNGRGNSPNVPTGGGRTQSRRLDVYSGPKRPDDHPQHGVAGVVLGAPNTGDHTDDDSDAAIPPRRRIVPVDAVDVLADNDTRVLPSPVVRRRTDRLPPATMIAS